MITAIAALIPLFAVTDEVIVRADYIEARTASVYAGACHAAGEYTTQGREAVLAWRFVQGQWGGQDLAGVELVAAIAADRNLAESKAERRAVLYVDSAAPRAAADAAVALVRTRYADQLGEVVAVRSTSPVAVLLSEEAFEVRVGREVRVRGATLPDRACCKMPFDRWYEPFARPAPGTTSLVGNCDEFRYDDRGLELELGRTWTRYGENNALVARVELR